MKKVLIITYYWPPSGGAGVQRWVKLTKYLTRMGIECHVLTVDENKASYQEWDESLVADIDSKVIVYKTNSFEPTNIYAKIVGKDKVPTSGFANVDNSKLSQKFVNAIRSNFFIPDPRIGWKSFAYRKAKEIIKEQKIKNVITTSPPHSVQMIGLKLKSHLNIHWIADINDPWTDIYYYKYLMHSKISHAINSRYERNVFENADQVITVSKGFKELFDSKHFDLKSEIKIITNGYDHEDFEFEPKRKLEDGFFNIVYTGTISDQYQPYGVLTALKEFVETNKIKTKITFVGKIDDKICQFMDKNGIDYHLVGYVKHQEAIEYQMNADLLLLFIPKVSDSEGIIPAKIFEYIAAKRPILGVGENHSDVGEMLSNLEHCTIVDYSDINAAKEFFLKCSQFVKENIVETEIYTRRYQAKQYKDLLGL